LGVIRVEPDSVVVVLNGAVVLTLATVVNITPAEEGIGSIRVEPNGLVVVRNGAVVLADAGVGSSAADKRFDEIRSEPDGLVEVLNGTIVLALAETSRSKPPVTWLVRGLLVSRSVEAS
jgi:hypothetical protein